MGRAAAKVAAVGGTCPLADPRALIVLSLNATIRCHGFETADKLPPMRRVAMAVVAVALLGCAVLAVVVWTGTDSADAARGPLKWVALGDSYSAGHGTVPNPTSTYFPEWNKLPAEDKNCARTKYAYGQVAADNLADEGWDMQRFANIACTGWTTDQIRDHQIPAIPAGTTIATITAGGNDLQFSKLVIDCLAGRCGWNDDNKAPDNPNGIDYDSLYPKLVATYKEILNQLGPNGHLYVLTYPAAFPSIDSLDRSGACSGINVNDIPKINRLVDRLGGTIYWAVQEVADPRIHFVDVHANTRSTGMCAEGVSPSEWNLTGLPVNGLVLDADPGNGFHPTRAGYRRMADLLADQVRSHQRVLISELPAVGGGEDPPPNHAPVGGGGRSPAPQPTAAPVAVDPKVSVDRDRAYTGETFTVTGTGFTPSGDVVVQLHSPTGAKQDVAQMLKADGVGRFSVQRSFGPPTDRLKAGPWVVWVHDVTSREIRTVGITHRGDSPPATAAPAPTAPPATAAPPQGTTPPPARPARRPAPAWGTTSGYGTPGNQPATESEGYPAYEVGHNSEGSTAPKNSSTFGYTFRRTGGSSGWRNDGLGFGGSYMADSCKGLGAEWAIHNVPAGYYQVWVSGIDLYSDMGLLSYDGGNRWVDQSKDTGPDGVWIYVGEIRTRDNGHGGTVASISAMTSPNQRCGSPVMIDQAWFQYAGA